mgnify:CR=1 FL=1
MNEERNVQFEVDPRFQDEVDILVMERTVEAGLNRLDRDPRTALAVNFSGDARVKDFNQRFREVEKTTDVLAFPADFVDPDLEVPYLGDILISVPKAARQAEAAGHALQKELQLLVVHGLLHLAGYDHREPEEKERMWALQRQILSDLGVEIKI